MNAEAPAAAGAVPRRRRVSGGRLPLVLAAILVVVLHALLLTGLGDASVAGRGEAPSGAAMQVRRIDEAPAPDAVQATEPAAEAMMAEPAATPTVAAEAPPGRPTPHASARIGRPAVDEPLAVANGEPVAAAAAPLPSSRSEAGVEASAVAAGPTAPVAAVSASPSAYPASRPPAEVTADGSANAASTAIAAPAPALLAAGDAPPPIYATRLPPSGLLRYEVRRGFLHGSGEMRWQNAGATYALSFEARIAGIALLTQTSTGRIDAAGLAPERFVDQRRRRSPQAANFQRESGRVSFSGASTTWPLYPGTQDRLSVLLQLAGIAAAAPESLMEGAALRMVVVGARGDANVWTIRSAGLESADTVAGAVQAIKLVRQARAPGDAGIEVWLDPARGYLPVHATFRNAAGDADYDILLERAEAVP